jgi:hypothetical protein
VAWWTSTAGKRAILSRWIPTHPPSAVVSLLENDLVTGQDLVVDGGTSIT